MRNSKNSSSSSHNSSSQGHNIQWGIPPSILSPMVHLVKHLSPLCLHPIPLPLVVFQVHFTIPILTPLGLLHPMLEAGVQASRHLPASNTMVSVVGILDSSKTTMQQQQPLDIMAMATTITSNNQALAIRTIFKHHNLCNQTQVSQPPLFLLPLHKIKSLVQ